MLPLFPDVDAPELNLRADKMLLRTIDSALRTSMCLGKNFKQQTGGSLISHIQVIYLFLCVFLVLNGVPVYKLRLMFLFPPFLSSGYVVSVDALACQYEAWIG